MADMALIQSAVTSLKTAADIAKGFLDLKSISDVQSKVIDLQSVILSAQSSAIAAQSDQFAMLEEVRTLKEEIAKIKAWETQKQRYKLVSPSVAAMAYALQKSMSNGEPPHYLCANCYQKGKPSILQHSKNKDGLSCFVCQDPSCKSIAQMRYRGVAPPKYAEDVVTEE